MRLIIVGNGSIGSPQGHLIDKFDTVVRLSGAKVQGYECLVGSKTDIHSVSRIEPIQDGAKVWIANPFGIGETPQRALSEAFPNGYITNPDMEAIYKAATMDKHEHPTLGLLTIFMAILHGKMFYEMPITITGFDFSQVGWPQYYWDITTRKELVGHANPMVDHHNYPKERAVTKQLIEGGAVKFLQPRDIMALDENCPPNVCQCFHKK